MKTLLVIAITFFSTVLFSQNDLAPINPCHSALRVHLDAVENKDHPALKATMNEDLGMTLVLPQRTTTYTVKEFMELHTPWFSEPGWEIEFTIEKIHHTGQVSYAVVNCNYTEAERNGVPYFNNMQVSYVLRMHDGVCYVVHDHASSLKKSTDPE